MSADELIECGAHFIREALQHLDAQDVANELDEMRLVIFVDLAQQVLSDVRMFFVQQLG